MEYKETQYGNNKWPKTIEPVNWFTKVSILKAGKGLSVVDLEKIVVDKRCSGGGCAIETLDKQNCYH